MQTWGFRLVLGDVPDLDQTSTAFYDHFEGTIESSYGRVVATVYLDGPVGPTLAQTAVLRLERTLAVTVLELDRDLVTMPEIASRLGRSRQSVQQLVSGNRGRGGFPTPLGSPAGTRIWDWATVNAWAMENLGVGDDEAYLPSNETAILNGWLAQRQQQSHESLRTGRFFPLLPRRGPLFKPHEPLPERQVSSTQAFVLTYKGQSDPQPARMEFIEELIGNK